MTSVLRPRSHPSVPLAMLAARVGARGADGHPVPDVRVGGVTLRAQDAAPGDLFAALPGSAAHGAEFAEATRRALLTSGLPPPVVVATPPPPPA